MGLVAQVLWWRWGGSKNTDLGENTSSPPDDPLPLPCSSDDSKSSSPEPVTHLKWDDPYYDIARHQIVEVAGEHSQQCTVFLLVSPPASQGVGTGGRAGAHSVV